MYDALQDIVSSTTLTQDGFLQMFIRLAHIQNIETPVTITVQGVVITGSITTTLEYMREVITWLKGKGGNCLQVGTGFEGAIAQMEQQTPGQKSQPKQYTYLNLKNARIIQPTKMVDILVWRGRVDLIDGFSIGEPEWVH